MFTELVPITLFVCLAFIIVGVVKVISDGRTRRQLIQTGLTPEQAQSILAIPSRDPDLAGALKWGLVVGSVGLALIVIQFLPYRGDQPITYGLVLVFAAAGLLAYLKVVRRLAPA